MSALSKCTLRTCGIPVSKYDQGFIQIFFLERGGGEGGGGNVDTCKGCMCASVHLLDFNKILDIFKNKNHQIQL